MDTQTVKTCSRCKMEKPVPQYSRNARNRDGLQNYCKQCHRAWYDAEHKRRFEAALALGHFTCRRCNERHQRPEVGRMNVLATVLQILGLVAVAVAGFLVAPALGALAAGLGLLVVGVAIESEG